MEYIRTDDGQIQADFSKRVGELLLQYERFSGDLPPENRFEATLTLCLLQALLTNTVEKIRSDPKKKNQWGKLANRLVSEEPTLMGLEPECVMEKSPTERTLRYRDIIECLRNALSHPLPQGDFKFPVTGYITFKSNEMPTGDITAFCFTQSPWVNKKGSDVLPNFQVLKSKRLDLEEVLQKAERDYGIEGRLKVQTRDDGKLQIFADEKPFTPVLRLYVTVQQLRTLTVTLSERLSECMAANTPASPEDAQTMSFQAQT